MYCGTCRIPSAHDQEFRLAGVVSVSLFGSVAHGESNPGDVNIAVRLGENFSHGGFNYFGRLEDLEQQLTQLPVFKKKSTETAQLPYDQPARRIEERWNG